MRTLIRRTTLIALCLAGAAEARSGPDVTLFDIQSTSNHGLVGTIRAYSIGSHTCNIGNQNLFWNSSGSPGLAMNAYRLYDGRLMQIGMSWVKTACCAGAQSGVCGTCNGAGGSQLGAGCLDVYTASWNSQQNRLAPRWAINGYSGAFQSFSGSSGDAIFKRLQIAQTDLTATSFPNALYFVEGVYVGTDDAANSNAWNNATYKRVTVNPSTFDLALVANSQQSTIPAIRAWRDNGLGAGVPDLTVTVAQADVPAEGRFWYAHKARDLGNGVWRYDYAVFNLNSDRSGGSFSVPVPPGVTVSNIGFNAPLSHSGDIYNNTPWTGVCASGAVTWTPAESFTQNPNANAIRWGTMFNFWFDATTAPGTATATLGLFKPFTPSSITFPVQGPSAMACYANCDGSSGPPKVADFACFINKFAAQDCAANCDGSSAPPELNVNDFVCFMNLFARGCS